MNPVIIAVLAGLCWGVGEVFTKLVLHTGNVGPLTAIAVRSTVALPVLWIIYFVAMKGVHASTEPPNWLDAGPSVLWKLVLGSGLIAGAGGMALFYLALSKGDISLVKPIAFTIAPAVAVILGWIVLKEPITLAKVLGVVCVLVGVVLLSSGRAPATT